MEARAKGDAQSIAAARAGFSERSARNIEKPEHMLKKNRHWRTRKDPFNDVWETEIVPFLEKQPQLQARTLFEQLQENYPDQYPDGQLRTLERRIRKWRALHGLDKEIIFRQNHPPGWQGISDFTHFLNTEITINGKFLNHILYHFRLPFSGWEYADVVLGGESYTALAEKLQDAIWMVGGAPETHRTDSLSAAYKNLSSKEKDDLTNGYEELCLHYGMEPTRNNKGVSHENGAIESPHRHLKNRIHQALILRGNSDFHSVDEYRNFVRNLNQKHNQRIQKLIREERIHLAPLPIRRTTDFTELRVRVSTSSAINVKSVIYSVPSRLIGMILKIHLFDDRLECFVGGDPVLTLPRVRNHKKSKSINYRHLIGSLSIKPQSFRNFIWREYLFPTFAFQQAWEILDNALDDRKACREYVAILKQSTSDSREEKINRYLENCLEKGKIPQSNEVLFLFQSSPIKIPDQKKLELDLQEYNLLFKGGK